MGIGAVAQSIMTRVGAVGTAAIQAGMHGVTGGIISSIDGGNFLSGFAAGAISSLVSSGIEALGTQYSGNGTYQDNFGNYGKNAFGKSDIFKAVMIAGGGLSGGISSVIAGGNFWAGARQGIITSGLNHLGHWMIGSGDGKGDGKGNGDGDEGTCLTCPKDAKEGDHHWSWLEGKNYFYYEGQWVANPVIGGSGGLELVVVGPAKGMKFLSKWAVKGAEVSVTKIGKYYKYTAKVLAQNGNGSYTIHTKYLDSYGKTIRYFHDTYNSTGRFIHRAWTEGSTKVHLWWNGIKQYGEKIFFKNR
jgi:hypothetical protein